MTRPYLDPAKHQLPGELRALFWSRGKLKHGDRIRLHQHIRECCRLIRDARQRAEAGEDEAVPVEPPFEG